ncbi:RNA polymerase sigma factor [Polyangium jinanense]|uniref:Sigma-70 family RNA polymerase sigma factor n=1 Tax=Polyangium jinanense TaxID=2829994 RepID=A0A9X3XFA6_9BACT|nr:sigma-70 family RNA polymerase sigma factor [Polyangium jinanense]MDC3989222.1 sigma-70 family RNA polymerase sigma factor [Polyangium jinanense]
MDARCDGRDLSPSELRAAIAAAYERHRGLVYRLALRYGSARRAWAEDVTQEVFLQLVRHAGVLDDLDALEGWLYRTTTRRCLNKLRKERLLAWVTMDFLRGESREEPSMDGDALAGARDELRHAFRALSTLPAKERVAFAMHVIDGLTLEEIGAVLGHTKGYVSKLVMRAQARLTEDGWEVGDGGST